MNYMYKAALLTGFILNLFITSAPAFANNRAFPPNLGPDTDMLAAIKDSNNSAAIAALEQGANPSVVTPDGCSALILAVRNGNAEIVKALLGKKADVNYFHEKCDPAIFTAVHVGNVDIVKLLVQSGANLNQDLNGRTPLYSAITSGKTNIVKYYLENAGDANLDMGHGDTILMVASRNHTPAIVWALIDHGADIEKQDRSGDTALMKAAQTGSPGVVQALLDRGAKIDVINYKGETALTLAQARRDDSPYGGARKTEIIDLLKSVKKDRFIAKLNPFKSAPVFKPYELIKKANQGGPSDHYDLAQAYYFGLKDTPKNLPEAYFWFSVCEYGTKGISTLSPEQKMILMQSLYLRHSGKDQQSKEKQVALMQMMGSPQLHKTCEAQLRKMGQELSESEQSEVKSRLDEWKETHPDITAQLMTEQSQTSHQLFMTKRLISEIQQALPYNNAYDIQGIKALIAAGADIKSTPDLLTMAAGKGRLDIVTALVEAGSEINSPTNNSSRALITALQYNHQDVASYLIERGAIQPSHQINQISRPNPTPAPPVNIVQHEANARSEEALRAFARGNAEEINKTMAEIQANPGSYNTNVLQALSQAFFKQYKDDEALFWHMAANLRYKMDTFICPPENEFSVSVLGLFAPQIENFRLLQPQKISESAAKAIEWDLKTPYNYNLQWGSNKSSCLPAERHAALRDGARNDFQMSLKGLSRMHKEKLSMDDLIPRAEAGDKQAQYDLGRCYFSAGLCDEPAANIQRKIAHHAEQELLQEGRSSKSFGGLNISSEYKEKAIFWLEKAAAQSHVPAYSLLATIYLQPKDNNTLIELGSAQKACSAIINAIKAGETKTYLMLPDVPWNRKTDRKIELYAWEAVSRVAAGEKMPVSISPYVLAKLSQSDLMMAQVRSQTYIQDYVAQGKPVCDPATLTLQEHYLNSIGARNSGIAQPIQLPIGRAQ